MMEIKMLREKKKEAIYLAEKNCNRYKVLVEYGVPSLLERMPSRSASVLPNPNLFNSSYSSSDKILLQKMMEEEQDFLFIMKMDNIFNNLDEPYRTLFIDVYQKQISLRVLRNTKDYLFDENIYKKLKKGFLKIALVDSDINFTYLELVRLNQLEFDSKKRKIKIKKEMKAMLDEAMSYEISQKIVFEERNTEEDHEISYINLTLDEDRNKSLKYLIKSVNQIRDIEKNVLISYLMKKEMKRTSGYYATLERALLALAFLNEDIIYDYDEFEQDIIANNNISFLNYIRRMKKNIDTNLIKKTSI